MPENIILNELRRLILLKVGINIINPSDCKAISIQIQKELNKTISETTIKRIFGFAEIKNQFSRYTINVLKEFANDQDVKSETLSTAAFPEYNDDLFAVTQNAKAISSNTIKHIKNRSNLPYEMTIGRKFAKYDFDYFYLSEQSFTAFISQPGYGKSILLSHLVHNLFLADNSPYQNDAILFINAADLFSSQYENLSMEDVIKIKLGIHQSTDLIAYFNEQYQIHERKLIIVIDGFAELLVNKVSKPKIFEKIINLISEIDDSSGIKLMLSMRSTMWNRFYQLIKSKTFITNKWFKGSYYNLTENSNIPALTPQETEEILKKISPFEKITISEKLKEQLKFPFHIYWYYQLKEKYPDFNSFTNIVFYEIVDHFIQEKVYQSNYATEKNLYCKKLIQLTNFGLNDNSVLKSDLIKEISTFKNAYMELLVDGILMEVKQYENGLSIEYVKFVQPHVFEYFLFLELLDVFNYQLNVAFFKHINTEYFGNPSRFQLLQWVLRFSLRNDNFEAVDHILSLNLTNYEKNYLIYFIAENFSYISKENSTLITQLEQKGIHKVLIKHLINFDFVDSTYKEAIKTLLFIVKDPENAVFYHTILGILDCLSLDQEFIFSRIEKLQALGYHPDKWLIDPHTALEIIYLKNKGITLAKSDLLLKIENFKSDPLSLHHQDKEFPSTRDILSFLLMLTINLFYGNPSEVIKITSSIATLYPKLFTSRKPFAIYLLNVLAVAKARTQPDSKTDQMEVILTNLMSKKYKTTTLYAQTLFHSLKAYQYKNKMEYEKALSMVYENIEVYKRNNLTIYEIFAYNLVINIFNAMGKNEMANNYTFKKMNILEEKSVNTAPFHSTIHN